MKPRTCFLWLWIANDAAAASRYSCRPLPAADMGLSLAAFRLVNLSCSPSPLYEVRLAVDGQTTCSCPAFRRANACKHADALIAAGLLPVQLVALLQDRTRLLDAVEAESQRLAEAAMEERTIHEHDARSNAERIADLTAAVGNLAERCQRLQLEVAAYHAGGPRRRQSVKTKAA